MADTEPQPGVERLANVRPDPRPASDHAGHDRWLVVRWTTDPADLTSTETADARALLATCPDCAALAADLEVISRATATSIVPPRPRDFRITPEQAVSARGGVLERARRWLGSPRSSALRPLAGAALTMGLVLVILAPRLGPSGTTGDGADGMRAPEPQATTVAKGTAPALEAPTGAGPEVYTESATDDPSSQADAMLRMADSPAPTQSRDTAAQGAASSAPDAPAGQLTGQDDPDATRPSDGAQAGMDDTTYALTLLGIVLAGTGLMVLLLGWLARRWQDPLLR